MKILYKNLLIISFLRYPVSKGDQNNGQSQTNNIVLQLSDTEKQTLKEYKRVIDKCKKIASTVHHSVKLTSLLADKQLYHNHDQHKLIIDCPTRWNSTFQMLDRINEQIEPLQDLFDDSQVRKKHGYLKLNEHEISTIKDILSVLQVFYDGTIILSAVKFISLSTTLPVIHNLLDVLKPQLIDSEMAAVLKKVLLFSLNFYIAKYDLKKNSTLAAATFLDIRVKSFDKVTDRERKELVQLACEKIRKLSDGKPLNNIDFNTITQTNDRPRLNIFGSVVKPSIQRGRKKLEGLEKEIHEYSYEPVKNVAPVEFWKINQQNYPGLFSVFKKLYCIPATSVPAEQLFSHAGYQVWDRRNSISPSNVNKVMVLYENYLLN